MTQDIGPRIGDPADHAMCHRLRIRASLEWTLDNNIKFRQQLVVLIKTAILEDVDLYAAQAAKRRHGVVEIGYHGHLLA